MPTLVRAKWFPAGVRLPDGTEWTRCRVYATTDGLYVYRARPAEGDTPDWHAPIDYAATPRPPSGIPSAGAGIEITTTEGLVMLAPSRGCGCSHPLKSWAPRWGNDNATTPWGSS